MDVDLLSNRVLGLALEVHKTLGPGLLESAYTECLAHELRQNGYYTECQKPLPIVYFAQILTYLKLGNYPLGLLIYFHTKTLKEGIKRFINSNAGTTF